MRRDRAHANPRRPRGARRHPRPGRRHRCAPAGEQPSRAAGRAWTRRRSISSIEVSREAVSTSASSAGCIPREGPLTSTTPSVRPDQGSRSGAAAQPQRVCDSTKCSGPWMCTPSPSTRLVPIALVPTLPSVQAEPPTKPRPSAIRRTPVEPTRQSTRPSTSATTTSWPASITEARVWARRGTNSPSALSARRRSSSPASRGGTSGVDPGSRPPAETRRHEAAMVVLGAEAEWAPVSTASRLRCSSCSPSTAGPSRTPGGCNALQPCSGVAHGCVLDHISLGEGGTMTQAPERETSAAPTQRGATPDPQARTDAWLAKFESALKARDIAAAAALFATDSYWRDLVAFTWNLKTVEGRDGVTDLLEATLDTTDPGGFETEEPADEADGVITAWIGFETATGRGRGLLRLKRRTGRIARGPCSPRCTSSRASRSRAAPTGQWGPSTAPTRSG